MDAEAERERERERGKERRGGGVWGEYQKGCIKRSDYCNTFLLCEAARESDMKKNNLKKHITEDAHILESRLAGSQRQRCCCLLYSLLLGIPK